MSTTTPSEYASFLIRLWRESCTGEQEMTAGWHGEVEHIQSGQRWTFDTLDETLSFLRQQADGLEELNLPVNEQVVG